MSEISTFEFLKNESLTHIVKLGIRSGFSKGLGFGFSEENSCKYYNLYTYKSLYLVCCLWLMMEKNGGIFLLIFLELKWISEGSVWFSCNSIFHVGRIVKSIYVIKLGFIKPVFFWDVIWNRSILSTSKILGKQVENSLLWNIAFLSFDHFCLDFLIFIFFSQAKFFLF